MAAGARSYWSTVLFHMIPGVTESSTRLPVGAPLIASRDSPILQAVYLVLLAAFLVGITLQVRWLRKETGQPIGPRFHRKVDEFEAVPVSIDLTRRK
jgi:hypothetical protein